MLKKLRIKFICILMSIVTVLLCTTFGLVVFSTKKNMEESSLRFLHSVSSGVGLHNDLFSSRSSPPKLPYFVIQQSITGEFHASSAGFYDLTDEEFLTAIWNEVTNSPKETGVIPKHSLRYLRKITPTGITIVCTDTTNEQDTIRTLLRNCSLLGLFAICIFFGVSVMLARWAVKPVEQAWKQQKQFIADASHELKTPLTVILTNAELLQSADYDGHSREQFASSILTMSYQMRGLVEGLLELARMDNRTTAPKHTELNLSQIIADSILPFEALFFEKEMLLRCDIENDVQIKGDSFSMKQILDIFLDNALKYASPHAVVAVHLHHHGHSCILSVINDGPPIAQADLKNLFKRFYRVDAVRQMNRSYGLGLSIAESIVREHRGKIWAESADGKNSFHVLLPTV